MSESVYKKPFLKQQSDYLKGAWNHVADQNLKGAINDLVSFGGNTIHLGVSGLSSIIRSKWDQDTLKTSEKLLPKALLFATIPVTVAAALVTVVGVSILIPPFVFAASAAGVVRSIASLIEDKKSLNNLNRKLITEDKVDYKIAKSTLSEDDKKTIATYMKSPQEIYKDLYQLRQDIIRDDGLDTEKKNHLIKQINHKIEDCFHGNFSKLNLALDEQSADSKLSLALEQKISSVNTKINDYINAESLYTDIDMRKSLKRDMQNFKKMHEHIYAQDIPLNAKRKMVEMVSQAKLKKSDIAGINAQLANHFINQQSTEQQAMLDQSFAKFINEKYPHFMADDLVVHLKSPRQMYQAIQSIHHKIPTEYRADFKKEILNRLDQAPFLLLQPASENELNPQKMIQSFLEKMVSDLH